MVGSKLSDRDGLDLARVPALYPRRDRPLPVYVARRRCQSALLRRFARAFKALNPTHRNLTFVFQFEHVAERRLPIRHIFDRLGRVRQCACPRA